MQERIHCDVTVTSLTFSTLFSFCHFYFISFSLLLPLSFPPLSSPPFPPLWQAEKRPCRLQDKMLKLVRAKRGAEEAKT